MFAYLHAFANKQVDQAALDKNVGIQIPCGSFSFAEIPKRYKYIFGMTGSTSARTESQEKLLQDYKIMKKTFVAPSIFAKNNHHFDEIADFKVIIGKELRIQWGISIHAMPAIIYTKQRGGYFKSIKKFVSDIDDHGNWQRICFRL